jgi:AcrR family transcriptional regulator
VSPKTADPATRAALLSTAAQLLESEGREALTLRRLTASVGTSTMAIYTHFGGMDELVRTLRENAFSELGAALGRARQTRDPLADLAAEGWIYLSFAEQRPTTYRLMFMEAPIDRTQGSSALTAFTTLVDAVERCIDAGVFTTGDAADAAVQIWALTHGVTTLRLANLLDGPEATRFLASAGATLFLGLGANRSQVDRAVASARRRQRRR